MNQTNIDTNRARRQATKRTSAVVAGVALLGFSAWVSVTLPVQVAVILALAAWAVSIAWLRTTYADQVRSPKRVATFLRVGAAMLVGASSGVVLLSAPASGGPVMADGPAAPDVAAIDRYVRSEMEAQRIPGLALGIVHDGRIVHLQGFGDADSSGREVTPQTPFFIGSVTKSFTAMAVMQLSDAGRVDLDAPVQRYLPWWRVEDAGASARVTVSDLLYQVSGLSKATGNAYATSGATQDDALEERVRALRSATLTAPVGSTWQYSNANYWTLGMIVQAVSGESYESYVQEHIFGPLEMDHSFTSKAEAEAQGLPDGHRYWYGFPVAADLPYDRGGLPAGGLASSAEDMAHYLSVYAQRRAVRHHEPALSGLGRAAAASRGAHRTRGRRLRDGLGGHPAARHRHGLPRRQQLQHPRQCGVAPGAWLGSRRDGERRELS